MSRLTLPQLEVSPELVEQRIHEVAALNRLCHSLAEFGKTLAPAPVEKPAPVPDGPVSRP